MTAMEMQQAERTLNKKERKYSELMRKSFEISLNNRERASKFHDKAKCLHNEIIDTRIALDMELS